MLSASPCPDQGTLRLFLLGQLAETDVESVETHVSECESCVVVLGKLQPGDPFESAIRAAAHRGAAPDPDADRLVARIVGSMDSHSQSLSTTASVPASTPTDLDLSWLSPPEAGDELGRIGAFRVLRVIGQGGMGVVFEAEDLKLQRRLALKVMLPKAAGDPAGAARFLREARASAKVRHPNVVTVYQANSFGTVPFIAMELLRGESLHERLRCVGQLPLKDVLNFGRQIALGLAAAHAQRLLHRDIKPANIWLEQSEDGDVIAKVLDFGLARSIEGDGSLTQSGMIVGTPQYMAPEQARGATPSVRSDLFSLGCVLYQMTTGRQPFMGRNVLDQLRALAVDVPPPVSELRDNAPAELSRLIHQLLEKTPSFRPASATAVAEWLREIATPQVQSPQVNHSSWQRWTLVAIAITVVLSVASIASRGNRSVSDGTQSTLPTSVTVKPLVAKPETSDAMPREEAAVDSVDLPSAKPKLEKPKIQLGRDQPIFISGDGFVATQTPRLAINRDGSGVIVWQGKRKSDSGWDVFARGFSDTGSIAERVTSLCSNCENDQALPSIAALSNGNFVTAWQSQGDDGSDWTVVMRMLTAEGEPIGNQTVVNAYSELFQTAPALAANNDGRFLVTWNSIYQVSRSAGWDVFSQVFNNDGTKVGVEFLINGATIDNQMDPAATFTPTGAFFISFNNGKGDIFAQRFEPSAMKIRTEFMVNAKPHRQMHWGKGGSRIGTNGSNRLVVVWHNAHPQQPTDGSVLGIFAQVFDYDGNRIGDEIQVNETTRDFQSEPSVSMLPSGEFFVVWNASANRNPKGIFGRFFGKDGRALSADLRLNEVTTGDQTTPDVAVTTKGTHFVVTWTGDGPNNEKGVFAKWIDVSHSK